MKKFEHANDMFSYFFGLSLTKAGFQELEKFSRRYGEDEVNSAVEIACNKYPDPVTAFCKIGGILYNRNVIFNRYFRADYEDEDGED